MEGRSLWHVLQVTTRGHSRYLGFTFGEPSCSPSLYTVQSLVKWGSADLKWIKILLLYCLFLASNVFRYTSVYCLAVTLIPNFMTRPPFCACLQPDKPKSSSAQFAGHHPPAAAQCIVVVVSSIPFEQKWIPQPFFSVSFHHVAPISETIASFYSIDGPVLWNDHFSQWWHTSLSFQTSFYRARKT